MKLLFMTVGTGRNREDIAKALHYGIEYHKPDLVYFYCSNKTAEETMPVLKPLLEGKYDNRTIIYEKEDDVQYLYNSYITDMSPHNTGENEIIVDFTSGTKAMSAAMFSAGVAVDADFVSYIVGKRDQTGRVVESTDVTSIKPSAVIAQRELQKAKKLFNEMDYNAASLLAAKIKKDIPGEPLAEVLHAVGRAYRFWEQYKWQQASDELKGFARKDKFLSENIRSRLKSSAAFCKRLQQESFCWARLVDLEQNAKRRLAQHRYDDAVARLYRAIEYFVQLRFKLEFQVDLARMGADDLDCFCTTYPVCSQTREKLENEIKRNGAVRFGLRHSLELLAELGDEAGRYMVTCYWDSNWQPGKVYKQKCSGKLQNWLKARNNSYLAHGTEPINPAVAQNLMSFYSQLLDKFAGKDSYTIPGDAPQGGCLLIGCSDDVDQMRKDAEFIKL